MLVSFIVLLIVACIEYAIHGVNSRIKWKERQGRRLKLEAPIIKSVRSLQHAQTGSDVIRDNLVLHCSMLDLCICKQLNLGIE